LLAISKNSELGHREQFAQQIEVWLSHFLEYREFLFVQLRENTQQTSEQFTSYLHAKQTEMLNWLGQRVVQVYGADLKPYAIELALLIEGMFGSTMHFFIFQHVPLSTKRLSEFILTKLDHLVA